MGFSPRVAAAGAPTGELPLGRQALSPGSTRFTPSAAGSESEHESQSPVDLADLERGHHRELGVEQRAVDREELCDVDDGRLREQVRR